MSLEEGKGLPEYVEQVGQSLKQAYDKLHRNSVCNGQHTVKTDTVSRKMTADPKTTRSYKLH